MQTFLPYPSFEESLRVLDDRRCGKQRVEAKQILNALQKGGGWRHHTAVVMWRGFEEALKLYMNTAIQEWVRRGKNNNMELAKVGRVVLPPWLGHREFHASHRGRLLWKDFDYYSRFGWKERPIPKGYLWPRVTEAGEVLWRDLREWSVE